MLGSEPVVLLVTSGGHKIYAATSWATGMTVDTRWNSRATWPYSDDKGLEAEASCERHLDDAATLSNQDLNTTRHSDVTIRWYASTLQHLFSGRPTECNRHMRTCAHTSRRGRT